MEKHSDKKTPEDQRPAAQGPSTLQSGGSGEEHPDGLAAAEERHFLHALLESIPDRIYFKDIKCRFLCISREMARFFRMKDPADAVGKTDFDVFTREHAQPAYDDEQRILQTGEAMVGKIEKETLPDGRVAWVTTTKMPFRNDDGTIIGTFGISRDITEWKLAEEQLERAHAELKKAHEAVKATQMQLIQAEKMQAVGQLAAGVAHEIRNPLARIAMAIDYLCGDPKPDPVEAAPVVQEMRDSLWHADAVVREIMDFASSGVVAMREADIHEIIDEAMAAVEDEAHVASVTLLKEFAPQVPSLVLDPEKIKQAVINLLGNAIDATPQGGSVMVRTTAREIDSAAHQPGDRSGIRLRVGDRVVIVTIEDTGSGIEADKLGKVFDAFVTTKPTGKGTGLGLTITRKIIELHRGAIQVENRPEGGVRVTLTFKAAADSRSKT